DTMLQEKSQKSVVKLIGHVDVLQNMTSLTEACFKSLKVVNFTNNLFQGSCLFLSSPGDCDPRLIGYPLRFGECWKGNGACVDWIRITSSDGNISVVNFQFLMSLILGPYLLN
ncbi:putative receptor protein kinase TMK1-like, partial [Trifolium medium]|nr:putative receptor protein kinase TMK1-like [Trifolium medium]